MIGGKRTSKADFRIECYGTVDELNAVIGMAMVSAGDRALIEMLMRRDLSLTVKEAVFKVGLVFIMMLVVFVIYNDISKILPPTYGLDGIRRVLIEGQGFSQVREPFVTLLVFLAVLLPFSLWVFGRAVRRAKREGSLIQY